MEVSSLLGAALRAATPRARDAARRGASQLQRHLLLLPLAVAVATGPFIATAYGPPWGGIQGSGTTATGEKLPGVSGTPGPYVVAVDPSVIPLGSKLKINPNPFGDPNIVFTAADTGGAIKGNRIDFFDPLGRAHQNAWGKRPVSLNVLGAGTPSTPPDSGSDGPDWEKLLLDAVFIGFGGAMIYRGTKRLLARPA